MLLAVLATVALLSMHGIAASSASAATPCGEVPGHVHAMPTTGSDGPVAQTSGLDPSHAGAVCLAILVGGIILALVGRTVRRQSSGARVGTQPLLAAVGVRGPPGPGLSLLCTWRT